MCSKKLKTLLFLSVGLLFGMNLTAQSRSHVMVAGSTNFTELATQLWNGQVHVNPIPFLGVTARIGTRTQQDQIDQFTVQSQQKIISGQLRVSPFGATKLFDAKDFFRFGFKSQGSFDDSWAQTYLSGIYLGMGYEYGKTKVSYIPDANLNAVWSSFDYEIIDAGPTLQLGYSISINHLYLDIGYRLRYTQPKWQGPVDIFQDKLLTKVYPRPYRRVGSLRLSVGTAF